MENTRDQSTPSAASGQPPVSHRRKVYQRTALVTIIAALAMAPGQTSAQPGSGSTPRTNLEVFIKPGNDRILGGIEAVIPFMRNSKGMPFLDLKGKIDDDDSHEINAALGYRTLTNARRWIIGGYLSYDYRDTEYENDYQWLTAGFEALSRNYDFRANYYHTSDDPEIIRFGTSGSFSGTSLLMANSTVEEPLSGGDLEIGMLLPFSDEIETRAYLGGYHFNADLSDDITGSRLRLEIRPRKNLIFGLEAAYDEVRGSQLFAELRFSFGYKNEKGIRTLEERMMEPIHRDIDGPMTTPDDITVAMQEPGSGAQSVFIHLDNANGTDPTQNGTVEHPYSSIASYYAANADQANTTLVIHQGDGTSTGYDQTLALQDGQVVWGEGFDSGLAIAGFGGPDTFPQMTTVGGPVDDDWIVIQLAQNNEVAGVALLPGEGGVGIMGGDPDSLNFDTLGDTAPSGAGTFSIHDNLITSGFSDSLGIAVSSANGGSSIGQITDNEIVTGTPIVLLNYAASGSASTQDVVIRGNDLSAEGFGFDSAIFLYNGASEEGNTATQKVTIDNNSISSVTDGIYAVNNGLYGGTATQDVTFSANTLLAGERESGIIAINRGMGIGGYGSAGEADGNPVQTSAKQVLTITGNTITANRMGVLTENYGMYSATATQDVTISDNTMVSERGAGIIAANLAFGGFSDYPGTGLESTQNLIISHNTVTSGDDNILLYNFALTGTAIQEAAISGNTITSGQGGVVFYNYSYGSSQQHGVVTGNAIVSEDDGIVAINSELIPGTQTMEITGNTIDSGYTGIVLVNYDNGTQESTVSGNTITSALLGIEIDNGEQGAQSATISGNTIDAGWAGIDIENEDSGIQEVTVFNTTLTGAGAGIQIGQWGDPDSQQIVDMHDNSIFGSAYGIYAINFESGLQQLTITDNQVGNDSGEDVIHLANEGHGTQDVDSTNNTPEPMVP